MTRQHHLHWHLLSAKLLLISRVSAHMEYISDMTVQKCSGLFRHVPVFLFLVHALEFDQPIREWMKKHYSMVWYVLLPKRYNFLHTQESMHWSDITDHTLQRMWHVNESEFHQCFVCTKFVFWICWPFNV